MKNMQKLYLSMLYCVIISYSVSIINAQPQDIIKKTAGPGFEIINKAPSSIWVSLLIDHYIVTEPLGQVEVPTGKKFFLIVDTDRPTEVGIYVSNPGRVQAGFSVRHGEVTQLSPQPNYMYNISDAKKTKYLTWNPKKQQKLGQSPKVYLYPQKGIFKGSFDKSVSGYPLSNNINANNIVLKKSRK